MGRSIRMRKITVKLKNATGLHARPASQFVAAAKKFKCNIIIEFNGEIVNAKNILGVLSLGIPKSSIMKVSMEGEDEEAADIELSNLLEGFEE
jgi:phosphocarrier protein HPr